MIIPNTIPLDGQMEFDFHPSTKDMMGVLRSRLKDAEAERDYFDLYEPGPEQVAANLQYVSALDSYMNSILDVLHAPETYLPDKEEKVRYAYDNYLR